MKVQFAVFKPSKIIHRLTQAKPFLQSGGSVRPRKIATFCRFCFYAM
jgi:hypothetical protein